MALDRHTPAFQRWIVLQTVGVALATSTGPRPPARAPRTTWLLERKERDSLLERGPRRVATVRCPWRFD